MEYLRNQKPKQYANLTVQEIKGLSGKNKKNKYFLVLTTERIFLILRETATIVWKFKTKNIEAIFETDDTVEVILKRPTKYIKVFLL